MELEDQWWKGQLAADIYQALRYKVSVGPNFRLGCQKVSSLANTKAFCVFPQTFIYDSFNLDLITFSFFKVQKK